MGESKTSLGNQFKGRFKVLVTRKIPDAGLRLMDSDCGYQILSGDPVPTHAEVVRGAAGVDGIVSLLTEPIDAEVMDAAPGLKVIANMAVGYDNIDVPEAKKRGILVTNTPEVLTETTADFAWALMMAAARRVIEGDAEVRAGRWRTWEPEGLLGVDLHGATLGLIGYGRIGQSVARRGQGFGMKVIFHDPERPGSLPIDGVLSEADFISLHVPLTPQTRNLIGRDQLRRCKRTAVLVNTSRGGVLDQEALAEELAAGTIFSAGLDVFEKEPLPPSHPLCRLTNVVLAPHIASASRATRDRMAMMAAGNLVAGLRGETPPNLVPELRS
ncbi:MAG TPA: D-glycerate dehydrogenase [Bacillota bacterium]|jgi:glyoxylate reductase